MKRKMSGLLAIVLLLTLLLPHTGAYADDSPSVGVAWSGNATSETYIATCEAIEAAGGTPVILGQVFSADLEYDDDGMLTRCKDENGALTPEAAKLIRSNTWQGSNAASVLEGITAVVFPGGEDISPSLYYTPQEVQTTEGFSPERDVSDYLLMSRCLENDIPILAICRGMQMLSVVSGAEMIQDIPEYMASLGEDYAYGHRNEPEEPGAYRDFAFHDVHVVEEDSILHRLTGTDTVHNVPSWHHQAVKSVEGTRLRVTGTEVIDGVEFIEAVERPDKTFVLGLQFHPEIAVVRKLDDSSRVFFEAITKKAAESADYDSEREREILVNRSELDGLGEIDGPIYVTGHKSPDSDSVVSAIGYAALLRSLGYDAQPVVLGTINNESKYILGAAGLDVPMLLEDASGCSMILVDHSDYIQSADGLQDAHILSIIDHHGDGTVTTGNPIIYDAKPIGATATIVWMRYYDYGVTPDRKVAAAMTGAILSDTQNMQSETTSLADREALKALSKLAGISDTDAFYQEMFRASISYDGMTDEEIFFSDYKIYEAGDKKYGIGCINAYDEAAAADLTARMMRVLPSAKKTDGLDMVFAQISVFHDGLDISYIVPSDEAAFEILKTAFEDRGTFDKSVCRMEPGISRRKVLVPAITGLLEAHPME